MTRWIHHFVTLLLEVEAGKRPLRHLRPMLHPDLLADTEPRPGRSGSVRRVRVQRHGERCEAVAVVEVDGRISALTISAVRTADGWLVDLLCRPDQPRRPRPTPQAITRPDAAATPARSDLVPPSPPGWQIPDGWARPAPVPVAA